MDFSPTAHFGLIFCQLRPRDFDPDTPRDDLHAAVRIVRAVAAIVLFVEGTLNDARCITGGIGRSVQVHTQVPAWPG